MSVQYNIKMYNREVHFSRLPVGSFFTLADGKVLRQKVGESSYLAWASPSGGLGVHTHDSGELLDMIGQIIPLHVNITAEYKA